MTTRLLVDLSSVLWASLCAGVDKENGFEVSMDAMRGRGEDKKLVEVKVWVNSATYGYENAMNHLVTAMQRFKLAPSDIILVEEMGNSKALREAIYSGYKAKRSERPPQAFEEFNKLRVMLKDAWLNVGSQCVSQAGVEADDVIGYLCQNLDGEKIILTRDGDLAVLVNKTTHIYRMDEYDVNPYGDFPFEYITVYKALVGDTSDNIPGARGFGPTSFLELRATFGDAGLAAMKTLLEDGQLYKLEEDIAELPVLQRILNNVDLVGQSYRVAKLMISEVNTPQAPLTWTAGMVRGRDKVQDERLTPYAQQVRLITADTFEQALAWAVPRLAESPVVALDIETAVPEESDEWLAGVDKVDVFGSKLAGLGLTFGKNGQYTFYFSVDHKDTRNVDSERLADLVNLIKCPILIQNFSFEGPILFKEWGEKFKNNGWYGFLPDVYDTKILSNYVDENRRAGLKDNSLHYLGYTQVSYAEVTTKEGPEGTLPPGGTVSTYKRFKDGDGNPLAKGVRATKKTAFDVIEKRQYKMNELTAKEVLAYGADDCICTMALYNAFRLRMEIEKSWDVAMKLEQLPAYATALAFVQGTAFDRQALRLIVEEDQAVSAAAWGPLRDYLISIGWEGSVCPAFSELDRANILTAVALILGDGEFTTMVRTPAKIAVLIRELAHDDAGTLAAMIETNDVQSINLWMARLFDGEPKLDLDSPTQMKKFLYGTLGLPVRLVNPCTDLEFKEKRELASAVCKHSRIRNGSQSAGDITDDERELLKLKAKTDDTAIDFALAFDKPGDPILKAIQTLKQIGTRRKLYYTPYQRFPHWEDNKIHAQANQCSTVTRRWSYSSPNLQQLPKRGEGVKVRRCFTPHHKDAVIISVDSSGQELRLQAGLSGDTEMLSCYVGSDLRDIHSITASGAMKVVWEQAAYEGAVGTLKDVPNSDYAIFQALLKSPDKGIAKMAKDLRTLAKPVNFGSAYGCEAPKLQELLVCDLSTAEDMLNAKRAKFAGYEAWKEGVEIEAMRSGSVQTLLGGIRHLGRVMSSAERGEAERAARQASNFLVQSAGAELTKMALGYIWKSGIMFQTDCVFFAPIHDECVFSVHRKDAARLIKVVHEAMSLPYTGDFPVQFIGSISLGRNFGDQIECGEVFDAARIEEALVDLFRETPASNTDAFKAAA